MIRIPIWCQKPDFEAYVSIGTECEHVICLIASCCHLMVGSNACVYL